MTPSPQNPEPFNRNRDARLYMLAMWAFSLATGTLLPYVQLDGALALVMGLLIFAATGITSALVVFTFSRYWARPLAFIAGVALSALVWMLLMALPLDTPSLPLQCINSGVALLAADLLWMTLLIGFLLIWTGRGGWPLLAAGSVVAIWTPLLMWQSSSASAAVSKLDAFTNTMLALNGQASPFLLVFCSALCAVPIGGIALLSRILRGLVREQTAATPPAKPASAR